MDNADFRTASGPSASGAECVVGEWSERRFRRREADLRVDLAMEVLEGGYWHYDVGSATFETSLHLATFVAGSDAKALDLDDYVAFVLPEDRHQADLSRLIPAKKTVQWPSTG